MPILFIISAISGSYPDIARNPDMFFFNKKFFYSSAFFMNNPGLSKNGIF